ncbi:MAG: tRNA dihydrouridine synthase DusB [Actinomycetota bacterium]|nr:tRNA dihydrouridine synthase DusB [Actinomycetota bacterium]
MVATNHPPTNDRVRNDRLPNDRITRHGDRVPAAGPAPGDGPSLRIGPLVVDPPVVLAPMAGVTNAPFRTLCRRFGAGLYVSEMVTARGLVEGNDKTKRIGEFWPGESPRSIQIYGVDPIVVGEAVRRLVAPDDPAAAVDHVDLNFGCPATKVTRKGGGAALPVRRHLLRAIIRAAVTAAGDVPVTAKFRTGVDEELLTYVESGRIAQDEGCAAVALHGRTAAQLYSGRADWSAIARFKEAVTEVPVLGNGDIWEASDALRMVAETGCDGVVVGRGCLGRPWLFGQLAAAFAGEEVEPMPRLGPVVDTLIEHADLLVEWMGHDRAMRDVRKHIAWYTKGYPITGEVRRRLMEVTRRDELVELLATLDRTVTVDPNSIRAPRAKRSGRQKVTLPHRWVEDRDDPTPLESDLVVSGG